MPRRRVVRSPGEVRAPSFRNVTVPAPLVAALCGVLLGSVTLLVTAWLWRAGDTRAAGLIAESALLLALTCVAAFSVLAGPARMRRARVPIDRVVPPNWWPRDTDAAPLLAACVGAPLVIGAGIAVLIFR